MFSSLRQLKFPKEFRIPAPLWPQDIWEDTGQIVRLILEPQENAKDLHRILKEIGTGLWRIRNRLESERNPSAEVRGAMRFLEATWDAMTQNGLEMIDHTGETVTGGESLKVAAYEETGAGERGQVVETIKPTIRYRGSVIQMGEVIVGRLRDIQTQEPRRNCMAVVK